MLIVALIQLLVSLANFFMLIVIVASLVKDLKRKDRPKEKTKIQSKYTVDLPVSRQPNYSDLITNQKPSSDLNFIRDV